MSDRNRSDIKKPLQGYLQKPVLQAPMAGSQDMAMSDTDYLNTITPFRSEVVNFHLGLPQANLLQSV